MAEAESHAHATFTRAAASYARGDFTGAAKQFEEFCGHYPAIPHGWQNLAACHEAMQDNHKTLVCLLRAQKVSETMQEGEKKRLQHNVDKALANVRMSGKDADEARRRAEAEANDEAAMPSPKREKSACVAELKKGRQALAREDLDVALRHFATAAEKDPVNVDPHNAAVSAIGERMRRIPIADARRHLETAKAHLGRALVLAPNHVDTLENAGTIFMECNAFPEACHYFARALAKRPGGDMGRLRLKSRFAGCLGRAGPYPQAVGMARKLNDELRDNAEVHQLLATIVSAMDRLSDEGMRSQQAAYDLCVRDRAVIHREAERAMCRTWEDLAAREGDGALDIGTPLDARSLGLASSTADVAPGARFGAERPCVIGPPGGADDIPARFRECEVRVNVFHKRAYFEGPTGAAVYSDLAVFGCVHLTGDLASHYAAGSGTPDVPVPLRDDGWPLVPLQTSKPKNHYHWVAEGLSRAWIAERHFKGRCRFLIDGPASTSEAQRHIESLALLGVSADRIVHYPAYRGGRAVVDGPLAFVEYRLHGTGDPGEDDMWSGYLPARLAVRGLGAAMRAAVGVESGGVASIRTGVLYVRRKGIREIRPELEKKLLDELRVAAEAVAKEHPLPEGAVPFHVFDTGDGDDIAFENQVRTFAGAAVIIGAHGAGLTNVVFADAAVGQLVELPMYPHVNRCFAYLAGAMGVRYWAVPSFRSYYHTFYDTVSNGGLVDPGPAVAEASATARAALEVALGVRAAPAAAAAPAGEEAPVLRRLRELSRRPLHGGEDAQSVDVLAIAEAEGKPPVVAEPPPKPKPSPPPKPKPSPPPKPKPSPPPSVPASPSKRAPPAPVERAPVTAAPLPPASPSQPSSGAVSTYTSLPSFLRAPSSASSTFTDMDANAVFASVLAAASAWCFFSVASRCSFV